MQNGALTAAVVLTLLSPSTLFAGSALRQVQVVPGDDLSRARPLALSPDGAHLYTASFNLERIFAFDRDALTGEVLLVESEGGGICTAGDVGADCAIDGDCELVPGVGECETLFENPSAIEVSSDGACVYVAGRNNDTVVFYERDLLTGELSLGGLVKHETCSAGLNAAPCATNIDCDTSPGAGDGRCLVAMERPAGLAISPDSAHVFVVANFSNTLHVLERVGPGCALQPLQFFQDQGGGIGQFFSPSDVVVSNDGDHVYALTTFGHALHAFERDSGTGLLTFVDAFRAGVCTAGQTGEGCSLDSECDTSSQAKDGECDVTIAALGAPVQLAISASGDFVYAVGREAAVFSRDGGTGLLTFIQDFGIDSPLSHISDRGGNAVAVSPTGGHVLTAIIGLGTLRLFDRDGTSGEVDPAYEVRSAPPLEVTVSGDGKFVYSTGGGITVHEIVETIQCPAAAQIGCLGPIPPAKGKLTLRDDAGGSRDKVLWKWIKGQGFGPPALGDPLADTSYALCIYDADGLQLEFDVPFRAACADAKGGSCWSVSSAKIDYTNKGTRIPHGVSKASVRSGPDGKNKILLKGAGVRLGYAPFSFTVPVSAQLMNTDGSCWEATYSAPTSNDSERFDAKPD